MKKPDITKGEWRIDKYKSLVSNQNKSISISCGVSTPLANPSNESKANAKAISAVPEMIDALIEVETELYDSQHASGEFSYGYHLVVEALKKAGCEDE